MVLLLNSRFKIKFGLRCLDKVQTCQNISVTYSDKKSLTWLRWSHSMSGTRPKVPIQSRIRETERVCCSRATSRQSCSLTRKQFQKSFLNPSSQFEEELQDIPWFVCHAKLKFLVGTSCTRPQHSLTLCNTQLYSCQHGPEMGIASEFFCGESDNGHDGKWYSWNHVLNSWNFRWSFMARLSIVDL